MSFQAYLDTIKSKTGLTPDDFRELAQQKNLTKYSEVMTWLKTEYGLGHGHANVIAQLLTKADKLSTPPGEALAAHFAGEKGRWRQAYDRFEEKVKSFGPDVRFSPNRSYINILRGEKKFGIVQVSSIERIDIGIKLKGIAADGRLESSGSWNAMVTHRVRLTDLDAIDDVVGWLRQAYDTAC